MSENKLYTEISDIVRNLEYFKSGKWKYENIPDKFKKRVAIDSLEIVKKRDSIALLKLLEKTTNPLNQNLWVIGWNDVYLQDF